LLEQVLPEPFLEPPPVGRLTHKGGPVQRAQGGEEVGVVLAEVREESRLALQAQVLPHHFHRDDLAVSQHRCRSTLAQALTLQHSWQGLVNNTKDGDNEVIPVHGALLRSVAMVPEAIKRPGLGDFQLSKPAHRVTYQMVRSRRLVMDDNLRTYIGRYFPLLLLQVAQFMLLALRGHASDVLLRLGATVMVLAWTLYLFE